MYVIMSLLFPQCCKIAAGQRVKKKLTDFQLRDMIKYTAKKPDDKRRAICEKVSILYNEYIEKRCKPWTAVSGFWPSSCTYIHLPVHIHVYTYVYAHVMGEY